jgi:hypothetical protein
MFYLVSRKSKVTPFELTIDNAHIEQKHSVKFLGITVDEKLEWTEHIKGCKSKLLSSFYAINSCKHYLNIENLIMLYNAIVYPFLTYGVLLWGLSFKTHIDKIVIMPKKIIRSIANVPYNAHTHPIFCKYKILKFEDLYKLYLGNFMFSSINLILPDPILQMYTYNREVHAYNTRQRDHLHAFNRRTVLAASSFMHKGPEYWNTLPEKLKHSANIKIFSKQHKKLLLTKYAANQ